MGFILKEKLKSLKATLKKWNNDTYGDVVAKQHVLVETIKALDLRSEEIGLTQEEMTIRKESFLQLRHLLRSKVKLTFQRSRSRCLKEGDANSRYFHSCIKARGVRNRISAL